MCSFEQHSRFPNVSCEKFQENDIGFSDDECLDGNHEFSVPLSPSALDDLVPSTNWNGGGTCGVYLLCDREGTGVAIFKPQDEETIPEHAVGMVGGENLYRERAAYLVSRRLGDLGVPATIIKTFSHPTFGNTTKTGSLQRFVPCSTDMSDLGPAGIPADEVHKIGCLDILLFNVDRHEGNILLRRTCNNALVPIDHGLCLPEVVSREYGANEELLRGIFFAWQTWPQARMPFSAKLARLLSSLTPAKVDHLVRGLQSDKDMGLHLGAPAWTTLKIGATILRAFARRSLADMADLVPGQLSGLLQAAWQASRKKQIPFPEAKSSEPSAHSTAFSDTDSNSIDKSEAQALTKIAEGPLLIENRDYALWERHFLSLFEVALTNFVSALPETCDEGLSGRRHETGAKSASYLPEIPKHSVKICVDDEESVEEHEVLRRGAETKELLTSTVQFGGDLADVRVTPPPSAAEPSCEPSSVAVVQDAPLVEDCRRLFQATGATGDAIETGIHPPSRGSAARRGSSVSGHSRRGPRPPPHQPRQSHCSDRPSTRCPARWSSGSAPLQCGGGVRGPSRWAGCWASGAPRRPGWEVS
jgi:hypothetical protein